MDVRLRAFYCPCCGARLPADAMAHCGYCDAVLQVEPARIEGRRPPTPEPALLEPPASLSQRSSPRFEMSLLSQLPPDASETGEVLTAVELSGDRFALLYLRVTDADARTVAWELPTSALIESLEAYGDPGLAANRALEALCENGFPHRLEVVVALFDPAAASAIIYAAGCRDAVWWVSTEEGRSITVATYHPALERKMLREQRDYFSNKEPLFMATGDLLLVLSAAYCGRGEGPYGSGLSGLLQTLNENLGDDPLRVVTLAKSCSFWSSRAPAARKQNPNGPLRIAAVQALPRALREVVVAPYLQQFGSALFEIALLAHSGDWLELAPLHNERWALMWASNDGLEVAETAREQMRRRILEILDRRDHGDNENPRRAGRYALEGLSHQVTRLAVIQLFDQWGRVKYYRSGWKQPVALGPRTGRDSDCSIQQFDEGGEATVPPGGRLFFPGNQAYVGQPHLFSDLATRWPGGKASLLYGALCNHWKMPPSVACLTQLARALVSDLSGDLDPLIGRASPAGPQAHLGMAVVTGKKT